MRIVKDFVQISATSSIINGFIDENESNEIPSTTISTTTPIENSQNVLTCVVDVQVNDNLSDEQSTVGNVAQDIYLLVDVSGSMQCSRNSLENVCLTVADSLTIQDRVCVVAFDSQASVVWPLANVNENNVATYKECILKMYTGGGTYIMAGLEVVLQQLAHNDPESRFCSLLVLSDGQTTGPRKQELRSIVEKRLDEISRRVNISVLAYTDYCDMSTMQLLAQAGNCGTGGFYYMLNQDDIHTAIGDCLGASASLALTDLKLQVFTAISCFDDDDDDDDLEDKIEINDINNNNNNITPKIGFYHGKSLTNEKIACVGAMNRGARHAFVITINNELKRKSLHFELSYIPVGSSLPVTREFIVDLQLRDGLASPLQTVAMSTRSESEAAMHCGAHVLRERVASLLLELADEKGSEHVEQRRESLELLHEALIAQLQLLRSTLLVLAKESKPSKKAVNKAEARKHKSKAVSMNVDTVPKSSSSSSSASLTSTKKLQPECDTRDDDNTISDEEWWNEQLDARLLFDERLLEALANDIGLVLFNRFTRHNEMTYGRRRHTAQSSQQGMLRRAAHEHRHQHSAHASAGVLQGGAYTTAAQLQNRMRFLDRTDGTHGDAAEVKQNVKLREPQLTDDQIAARQSVDDELVCYVSLDNWREAHLGLALLVEPRTNRELRRGLLPRAVLAGDVLSAASFDRGVRAKLAEKQNVVDREADDDNASVVVSSSRGRINAWLPLYINATHWRFVRRWAQAAISIIGTQYNDNFNPVLCLSVCSKLLIQSIVRFTVLNDVSERTLQQFLDVHRVFLAMAEEYPAIRKEAESRLASFIDNPNARRRGLTPDLGDLIMYLCITDKYSWKQLAPAYVTEAIRRSAYQMGPAAKRVPRMDGQLQTLLKFWAGQNAGGNVTMFCLLFLDKIARPPGQTVAQVAAASDARWGRAPRDLLELMHSEASAIATRVLDVPKTISTLMLPENIKTLAGIPSGYLNDEAAVEIVLWGFSQAQADQLHQPVVPLRGASTAIPNASGPLTEQWREQCRLHTACDATPAPPLDVWHTVPTPLNAKKRRVLARRDALAPVAKHMRRPAALPANCVADRVQSVHRQECACKRCAYNSLIADARQKWLGLRQADQQNINSDDNNNNNNEQRRLVSTDEPSSKDKLAQQKSTMFVGGLAPTVDELKLFALFPDACGLRLVRDNQPRPRSRGYAFVRFPNESHMQQAMYRLWCNARARQEAEQQIEQQLQRLDERLQQQNRYGGQYNDEHVEEEEKISKQSPVAIDSSIKTSFPQLEIIEANVIDDNNNNDDDDNDKNENNHKQQQNNSNNQQDLNSKFQTKTKVDRPTFYIVDDKAIVLDVLKRQQPDFIPKCLRN